MAISRRGLKWSILRASIGLPVLASLIVALLHPAPLLRAQVVASPQVQLNNNQRQQEQQQQQQIELHETYPYYMQSPIVEVQKQQEGSNLEDTNQERPIARRTTIPVQPQLIPVSPSPLPPLSLPPLPQQQQQQQHQHEAQMAYQSAREAIEMSQAAMAASGSKCLYDKSYFARFDQCLDRKPYPTIGLPAFKNDDLLVRTGLSNTKHGCSFILTNGLFKNYQITRYSIDSESKCLDDSAKVQLLLQFSNVTLYYLWQLRCLNYANQLLDDATLDARTLTGVDFVSQQVSPASDAYKQRQTEASMQQPIGAGSGPVCVGSSQNFGFASLQLTNVEARVELASDIYKNWRITNITLSMLPSSASSKPDTRLNGDQAGSGDSFSNGAGGNGFDHQRPSTAIRDFTFETLDGDELNWRYLNLYENWTRNRLHSNFLDQFRRFVWVSLARCLGESSDKLPLKLVDLFGHQKYN